MHESLGQYLQQARSQKGYSLYDVAMMTCINYGYLKAVEADEFSKLPGQTVAKAYVLAYARCIALEETEVQKRFAASAGVFYGNKGTEPAAPPDQTQSLFKSRLRQLVSSLKSFF